MTGAVFMKLGRAPTTDTTVRTEDIGGCSWGCWTAAGGFRSDPPHGGAVGLVRDDVARVDDQRRVLPQRLLEELAVRREHDHAVGGLDLFGRPLDGRVQLAIE